MDRIKATLATRGEALSRIDIRWYAALCSLLLSSWLIYTDGVVNNDGIIYLHSAQAFIDEGWSAAVAIYPWPFYSGLIALLHRALGISIENVAYLINTALFVLVVTWFVSLVKEASASGKTALYAALLILILPVLNDYRAYTIRDVGYWAFYLGGLLYFLRYLRTPLPRFAFGWGACMLLATLFRIEGLAFLVLIPLILLVLRPQAWSVRLRNFLNVNAVFFVVAIALLLLYGFSDIQFSGRLGDPILLAKELVFSLREGVAEKADALEIAVLGKYTKDFATSAVVIIMLTILFSYLLFGFGFAHLLCTAQGIWRAKILPEYRDSILLLSWAAAIHLAILVVFVTARFFMTGRFVVPLVLTLLVFAPLGLQIFRERWKATGDQRPRPRRAWAYPALCVLLIVAAVDGSYSFGPSKKHLKEAGLWIDRNTPPASKLLSNDGAVGYYANRELVLDPNKVETTHVERIASPESNVRADYLALNVKRRDSSGGDAFKKQFGDPLKRFRNNRGDQVLIYAVTNEKRD